MEVEVNEVFNKPQCMKDLIGKYVRIITIDKMEHQGHVYVIDPETYAVVLIQERNKINLEIITGHSIKEFEIDSSVPIRTDLLIASCTEGNINMEAFELKKKKVKDWLSQHLIFIEEEGPLLKLGKQLVIEAPYTAEQCFSNNVIVLDRIKTLLSQMPS